MPRASSPTGAGFPLALLAAVALAPAEAGASPNVPLDDPVYVELARLEALGRIPLYQGGLRPLTEARVQELLAQGGVLPDPTLLSLRQRGLWAAPLLRSDARLELFHDELRPYSDGPRPIGMVGGVEISCEHQEGRPCGQGGGAVFELDSAAGYGRYLSAYTRLRFDAGTLGYAPAFALDRAYLDAELGPIALEVGRDLLVLGPGSRTQLLWGDNPLPLDQVRISTAHPIKLGPLPMAFSALYFLGRLRNPQTFNGTLVSGFRLQFDLFNRFQLAVGEILQLDGDGAYHYSFWDFLAEHYTRTNDPAGVTSNRRASMDLAYTFRALRGLRVYYQLVLEDFRKSFFNMLEYLADHEAGVELPILTARGRHGLLLEYQHNGVVSQSHSYFTTGMTNGGRAVGSPLGPDTWSIYASARLDLRRWTLRPWTELARLSSDSYSDDARVISRVRAGTEETRIRFGLDGQVAIRVGLRVQWRALYEHVDSFAFTPGATRDNVGSEVALVWAPRF